MEEMPPVQHPFLNVFELERLLYTGKTACNHADEVWPGLYLGDQYVPSKPGPGPSVCACVCVCVCVSVHVEEERRRVAERH